MDQSRFIRGLLSDPSDPQLPQYVPENDFGPRAFGLLNEVFPDPNVSVGNAIRQYQGGDPLGAFETMFGAMPTTGALNAARGRFGGAVMSPVDELYHGSPVAGLTTIKASQRGPLGPGVYTSPASQISGHYAGEGGTVYKVPHESLDIYRGEGHRTDDQWFGYKDDKRRLLEALPDEHRATLEPFIERMWSGDGYPTYQEMRRVLGGDEAAQAVFKKAGFHGISGQIDGPETLIFGDVNLPGSAKPPGLVGLLGGGAAMGAAGDKQPQQPGL